MRQRLRARQFPPPEPGAAAHPPALYTGIELSVSAQREANGSVRLSHPTVRNVIPGSPADSAGVAVGDVIVEINGRDTRTERSSLRPAAPNTFRLRRGDEEFEVVITTMPRPTARQPRN